MGSITLRVNGLETIYQGDPDRALLSFLRGEAALCAAKDGCSGQAACGACLVEVDGRAALACVTPMKKLEGASVVTIEGFPARLRDLLGRAFAAKGAVQCGFCTPGLLTRTKLLLEQNPHPTREDAVKAVRPHLCRCTGYAKIVDAVLEAAACLREDRAPDLPEGLGMGERAGRIHALDKALGTYPFIDDMRPPGLLHGALAFCEHPRARVLSIDVQAARGAPGVAAVLTAVDIPGERVTGFLVKDWPMMLAPGDVSACIGDVLALVVADTPERAQAAALLIKADYEILTPLTDPFEALQSEVRLQPGGNLLAEKRVKRGDPVDEVFARSAHVATARFSTGPIEHAFLETECALAQPQEFADGPGVRLYSHCQGIYAERRELARILALPESRVRVTHVDAGGAFGGKEDLTVQHHAALAALLLGRPVKVRLTRPQSLRMHPKRHAMVMDYTAACDEEGTLTAVRARITGDSGAYASLGGPVMSRAGTHATGAYHVPHVDIVSRAVYTNNPPAGAMRGFGVNQVTFAMEGVVEELCRLGGFDPLAFRLRNAMREGSLTAPGQRLGGGVRLVETLEAVRPAYEEARAKGLACGLACAIKNAGIGNGVPEVCEVAVVVLGPLRLRLCHGWSEMGQGIGTVGAQILRQAAGLSPEVGIDILVDTDTDTPAGSTTASRGTFQFGNAVLKAGLLLKAALAELPLGELVGERFTGRYACEDTVPDVIRGGSGRNHVSFSFATHLAILDAQGAVARILAAHDAGRMVNPLLFEGQIEGGVAMGLGFAVSERLPLREGRLTSEKFRDLGLLRSTDMPAIEVVAVDGCDPEGPFGAKGVGEIGCIPTTAAVALAFARFDGRPRFSLPVAPVSRPSSSGDRS